MGPMSAPPIVSYGGGVQSTALLVLAAKGYIDFQHFVFANVGDDSEHPATIRYVQDVAFDYAAAHGIQIHEVGPARGMTLRQRIMSSTAGGDETIPIRGANGMPFARGCTAEWKVGEVEKWLIAHGATVDDPAPVAIGFSTDEYHRAKDANPGSVQVKVHPLLHMEWRGGTGLSRADCEQVIRDAGLPVPVKSSCYFCPFHKPQTWREMARDEPELFEDSCRIEEHITKVRAAGGRAPVFLTRFGKPLREAITPAQDALFVGAGTDDEDDGYRCGDVCDT
jgi:hypothetical protein